MPAPSFKMGEASAFLFSAHIKWISCEFFFVLWVGWWVKRSDFEGITEANCDGYFSCFFWCFIDQTSAVVYKKEKKNMKYTLWFQLFQFKNLLLFSLCNTVWTQEQHNLYLYITPTLNYISVFAHLIVCTDMSFHWLNSVLCRNNTALREHTHNHCHHHEPSLALIHMPHSRQTDRQPPLAAIKVSVWCSCHGSWWVVTLLVVVILVCFYVFHLTFLFLHLAPDGAQLVLSNVAWKYS